MSSRPKRGRARDGLRLRGRPQSDVERIEQRIDIAEAQLSGMREVRSSIFTRGLPTLGFVGVVSFTAMGWGPTEPLPVAVGGILLAILAAAGVGAHFGIRTGERRLEALDEELALSIGRERLDRDQDGPAGIEA